MGLAVGEDDGNGLAFGAGKTITVGVVFGCTEGICMINTLSFSSDNNGLGFDAGSSIMVGGVDGRAEGIVINCFSSSLNDE
mmetsp:Transcript_33443/g.38075  ORF Transcript_33443/g.38075 Transcript_33443/m.38075 type:complete len:81 (-) Transcript_33443:102-344(-)